MSGAQDLFLAEAERSYVAANAGTMRWLLARPALGGGFLNSKQNSITLADYTAASGLRGPAYTYGWIQGRGLEALTEHAAFFLETDPALAARIDSAGRSLYARLAALWGRDKHAYFCYDAALTPVIARQDGTTSPQSLPADIFTYSDIFVLKGLIAAAARYDGPTTRDRYIAQLPPLVAAIETGRFQMNERCDLSDAALAEQPDDFGPRMILLGAAGMLKRVGRPDAADFADRFVAHVLDHHFDPASGLLRNLPGGNICNVGHGIELVGFALDFFFDSLDKATLDRLQIVLFASFKAGFQGPGIRLAVSVTDGTSQSPYCPWWSLPETIRAAALCYERSGNAQALAIWKAAHNAFFDRFWRGEPALAYQTLTEAGPVDYVPATPDLDPGYHTGLSLLAAIHVAQRLSAGRLSILDTGA